MNEFAIDVETTINNKGDPFDTRNRFVLGGFGNNEDYDTFHHSGYSLVSDRIKKAKLVIGFNIKFDLHWLRNIGCIIPIRTPIWDCQLAEFILSNQKNAYPSLEESCARRGLGHKIDTIKLNYWDKGIDTNAIPIDELKTYLAQDVNLTYNLYLAQKQEFEKPEHKNKYTLFRMQCYDLLVLEEMEYNGYKYDSEASEKEADRLDEECTALDRAILSEFVDVPINLASPTHISCMLYGGTIEDEISLPIGVYKTGEKAGLVKYRKFPKLYTLPQLIPPLRGTELKKEGQWKTDEDTLRNLQTSGRVRTIIDNLLARRGIAKLQGTYYRGVPKLMREHSWANSIVHGQLNQCVAKTSRLSATKPNSQNMPGNCKQFCVSRYD